VDAFLEHRPEFLEVGKRAIAGALLPRERIEHLFSPPRGQNWYEYLFRKMNAHFDEFRQNALSIVTFNYDRSLEDYLLTALRNSYGRPFKECAEQVRHIPIIHVYGQLGQHPELTDGPAVAYGRDAGPPVIVQAADGIKIIHEAASDAFAHAHKVISEAQRLCFIGFGYDSTNLERLLSNARKPTDVCGSAVGVTGREGFFIQNEFKRVGCPNVSLDHQSVDALDFLRNQCPLDWL
jgi:hypothetical protein